MVRRITKRFTNVSDENTTSIFGDDEKQPVKKWQARLKYVLASFLNSKMDAMCPFESPESYQTTSSTVVPPCFKNQEQFVCSKWLRINTE
jgi:hypothetical protein